jgi:hypothetical protein
MIRKEPESPWWLVCANLVDEERVSHKYWSQWLTTLKIEDITGHGLLLATQLYSRWTKSALFQFDPRIVGNAKRAFYQNLQYAKAIDEIDGAMDDKGIAHAWLRESGIRRGSFQSGDSLPVHQLDILIKEGESRACRVVLDKLGWIETGSTVTFVDFANAEGLKLRLFHQINPHWTQEMHQDLGACISQESSGSSLLLDLLSQIQLERKSVDWLRIYESMLLLRHLMTIGKWETLTKGAQDYLVMEPLMKVYHHFVEIYPHYSGLDQIVPGVELRLHATYATYMKSGSFPDKAKYHLARFRAINSVTKGQLSPLNYLLAARGNRLTKR